MKICQQLVCSISTLVIILVLSACGSSSNNDPEVEVITLDYQLLIDQLVNDKIPGVVLLVETPENKFLGSAGLANIESQQSMEVYQRLMDQTLQLQIYYL